MKQKLVLLLVLVYAGALHAQVNLQSGSATFSLPMFSWQDTKSRLNAAVSLSYNSGGGLKTGEIASPAGQGWSLMAGGVITRIQVGEPDDQKPNNGSGIGDIHRYPAGYLYNNTDAAAGCPTGLQQYPIYPDKNRLYKAHNEVAADREMDYFSFQFNGKSGMLVISKATNASGRHIGYFLGDTKMKVEAALDENIANTRTTITAFYITDETGLVYEFAVHGKAKVMRSQYTDATFNNRLDQPKFKRGKIYYESTVDNDAGIVKPWIINSWHLRRIYDPFKESTVEYAYTQRTVQAQNNIDIVYSGDNDYILLSRRMSKNISQDLSSITFPDGYSVRFNYGTVSRPDLPGTFPLASVEVKYNSRFVSQFKLATSYFILNRYGTPKTDFEKRYARLCLRSVTKLGVDKKNYTEPYIFDYYIGGTPGRDAQDDVVPGPYSPLKDIWGYYNGKESKSTWGDVIDPRKDIMAMTMPELKGLCFQRDADVFPTLTYNPKPGYAMNGLLRQIVYPTGGALGYEYEQNEGYIGSTYRNVGGVHVARTKLTDGGYANGCDNPIVTNYYFTDGAGHSSLWGLETPKNQSYFASHWEPEDKKIRWSLSALLGKCEFNFKYPGVQTVDEATSADAWAYILTALSAGMDAYTVVNNIKDVVNFVKGGFKTFGPLLGTLVGDAIGLAISCLSNPSKDMMVNTIYSYDLNGSNPLPAQFRRVEVVQAGGGNGKTVHEFTSDLDYALWVPQDANPTYSSRQRFASWVYGLPSITTVYDSAGAIVKKTVNRYSFDRPCTTTVQTNVSTGGTTSTTTCAPIKTQLPLALVSMRCHLTGNQSQRGDQWETPDLDTSHFVKTSAGNFAPLKYYLYTGRTELDTTIEYLYKQGDASQFNKTVTTYTYNTSNYQVSSTSVTQSNGDVSKKFVKYNDDFPSGAFATLTAKNIYGVPVDIKTAVQKSSGLYILNEKVTEFDVLPNNDVKPVRILEQRTATPVASVYWHSYGETGASFATTQTMKYDAAGNMVGMVDEGGRTVTNIFGYNDKYVIASVINADPVADKPAYTSFETAETGNWSVIGGYAASTNAITGSHSAVFVSNTATAATNASKAYLVTFWASAPLTVSGGAVQEVSAPTINGLTYYQYRVPSGNSWVSVSGSATVDELRLYPADARMRTVAFAELVGKTEDCDENNRTTHYTYDDQDRPRLVKDEKGNVVKMYEYAVAVKQKGCISSFSNPLIVERITRGDCDTDHVGTEVEYTIYANTYTAATQEELDQKIEEALAGLQTYANNNGSCSEIFRNVEMSHAYPVENCALGYKASDVTYTVPAGRYTAPTQDSANALAAEDTAANGPGYANRYALEHGSCAVDTDPIWETTENADEQCEISGGSYTGYVMKLYHNVNPNVTVADQYKRHRYDTAACHGTPSSPTLAPVNLANNDVLDDYNVKLYDPITDSLMYSFYLPASMSLTSSGTIPEGNYTIRVSRVTASPYMFSCNVYTGGTHYYDWLSGAGALANVLTFYSVAVSGTFNVEIN